MNVTEKTIALLRENIDMLNSSFETLSISVKKCIKIGKKSIYSFEESESFDSLTSKFARSSDIYTQKVIKSIWIILKEPFVPFIDMMNIAEKYGIIDSADALIEIRELRNTISHEYIPESIPELVSDVLEIYKDLEQNINKTIQFVKDHKWL